MNTPIFNINSDPGKKVYFASDFHLGAPTAEESRFREKKIVSWLSEIKNDAAHVFLLGDIFDFWFEYKYTIPKGFTRLMAKLRELRDDDIPVTFFTGNHDMWMFGYFEEEFGIKIFRKPVKIMMNNKSALIGHGDGLGPGDKTYKIIKSVFENRFAQGIFSILPSYIGVGLANFWSGKSREKNMYRDREFMGEDEWLLQYCRDIESEEHHDLYIFGHRHLPIKEKIADNSYYFNIGDWVISYTFGVFDGDKMELKKYDK